jgi:hypothetical protein
LISSIFRVKKSTLQRRRVINKHKTIKMLYEKGKNNFPNAFFPMIGFIGTDIKEISIF